MVQVIFEIDAPHGNFMNVRFEAFYKKQGLRVVKCAGSWHGVVSKSYMCSLADYCHHVKREWTSNQTSVLHVTECNKAYVTEVFKAGDTVALGNMHSITAAEAVGLEGWTRNLETGLYYTAREGNPDGKSPQSKIDEYNKTVVEAAEIYVRAVRKVRSRVRRGEDVDPDLVYDSYQASKALTSLEIIK